MANTAVVYDRNVGDKELNFEASGALLDASLVMRDRETDSWWSIMTSDAIAGDLGGAKLEVLPVGEKATWKDWSQRYPDTLVLSVEGEEHVDTNPYDNYFSSGDTFRDLEIEDVRLQPKAHIYGFWYNGEPWAVSHKAYRGGAVLEADGFDGRSLFLYRSKKGPMYESSRAYLVDADLTSAYKPKALLKLLESGAEGAEPLPGFDTFWYTWVSVNENTHLIR